MRVRFGAVVKTQRPNVAHRQLMSGVGSHEIDLELDPSGGVVSVGGFMTERLHEWPVFERVLDDAGFETIDFDGQNQCSFGELSELAMLEVG
jgi:hypothetical protein